LAAQAEVFVQIGLIQSAVDTYRAALALEGGTAVERAVIHRGLGSLYARLNNNAQASKHFEAALVAVQDDETGATLTALGDVYRAQDQPAEAMKIYQQAIDTLDRPSHPVELAAAQRALGEIYIGFGKPQEAQTALEAALDIEKNLPQQDGGRIVKTLHNLARVHELRSELDLAVRRHHEALVYQDVRYTPESYVDTLRELGRLYALQRRLTDASKAFEEALGTEANLPTPNTDKVNEMTEALADVYRAQGRLEAAAKLYKQVVKVMQTQGQRNSQPQPITTSQPAEPPRDRAAQALQTTEAEIARHVQTLNAAEQSWTLLNRVAKPDLKGLVFVRALQSQTCSALGRHEESDKYLVELVRLLENRRDEVKLDDPRSVMRALAMLLQAYDNEKIGRTEAAQQAYRHALDIAEHDSKTDAALVWAIRQKAANGVQS
jgi:tetratricopeptide (TPR) repeat protein